MSASRIYLNSQNRSDMSDNPSNFTVALSDTQSNVKDLELTNLTIESLWYHPTIPDYEKNVHMNVTGHGDVLLTVNTRKLFNTPPDLVAELNALYQTETSTADSPFVYSSDTKRITIVLTSTFTISPTAVDSMWERLGYSPGDATSSTTVGSNEELALSSSPNMLRTSLIYIGLDKVSDASNAIGITNILASIPLESSEYGWVQKYEQAIDNNVVKNVASSFDRLTVTLYDDKFKVLTMQPNALVAMQLHVEHDLPDINNDGKPDGKVRFPSLGLFGMG